MVFYQDRHITLTLAFAGINSIFFIILFTFLNLTSVAQNPDENFQSVDKNTYLLYTQQNWDSLIKVGNFAINSGIDYFYLRQRIGIAYYNKENYLKAEQHFEKALEFNASDATTQEYLYYCYIYSNQKKEARILSTKFSASLKNKIQPQKNYLEKIYFETGPTFSNNIDKNQINRSVRANGLEYREQDLNDNKYYVHAGLELNISKRLSVYLGYAFLTISKLKQIYITTDIPPGNNFFGQLNNDEYNMFQNEFYGNLKYVFGNGFKITPAYHLVYVKFNTIYNNLDLTSFAPNNEYQVDTSFSNHIVALTLNKKCSLFDFGITSSWSGLNNKTQYQLGGIFSWFPRGNLNLYTTSSLVSAWQGKNNRFVFDQLVGGKVSKKLWIEGYVTLGEMVNFNEKNAFLVQNSGDKIKFRTGLNFIVLLSKKVELSFRYIYLQEEGYRVDYTANGNYNITILDYQNNTIIGGLKWTL